MGVRARTGQDSPLGQGEKKDRKSKRRKWKVPRKVPAKDEYQCLWKIQGQPPNPQSNCSDSRKKIHIRTLFSSLHALLFYLVYCWDFSGKQLSVIMSTAALPLLLQHEEWEELSWQLSLCLSLCSLWMHFSVYLVFKKSSISPPLPLSSLFCDEKVLHICLSPFLPPSSIHCSPPQLAGWL